MATSTKLFAITATTDDTPLITETVMFAIKTYRGTLRLISR